MKIPLEYLNKGFLQIWSKFLGTMDGWWVAIKVNGLRETEQEEKASQCIVCKKMEKVWNHLP